MKKSLKFENLILVRIMVSNKPFTPRSDIWKDLKPLLGSIGSYNEIKTWINGSLELLEKNGHICRTPKKSSDLTDLGRKRAMEFLNIDQLPQNVKWKNIKNLYLPALALDVDLKSGKNAEWIKKADSFRVVVLKKKYDLPLSSKKPTLIQAVDSVLAKKLNPTKSGIDALRTALVRSWMDEKNDAQDIEEVIEEPELVESVKNELESSYEFDPEQFGKDVLETARQCETGWFDDDRVFISYVWQKFKEVHPEYGMDENMFKVKLSEHVRYYLSRADMVSAMEQKDVSESETRYLNATYHFVRVERR